jgi:hypothetical protein
LTAGGPQAPDERETIAAGGRGRYRRPVAAARARDRSRKAGTGACRPGNAAGAVYESPVRREPGALPWEKSFADDRMSDVGECRHCRVLPERLI